MCRLSVCSPPAQGCLKQSTVQFLVEGIYLDRVFPQNGKSIFGVGVTRKEGWDKGLPCRSSCTSRVRDSQVAVAQGGKFCDEEMHKHGDLKQQRVQTQSEVSRKTSAGKGGKWGHAE